MVLVHDNSPRLKWKMAVVDELSVGDMMDQFVQPTHSNKYW